MEVRQGISSEYAREKFDIILDETDLTRIANEYGLPQDTTQLTTVQAMLLLTLDAERFVLVQAPKYGRPVEDQPDGTPGVRTQIRNNREQFAVALSMATGLTLAETRKRVMPEGS